MADAKQCDRCKKYYNKNSRYVNPHQFDDIICTDGPIETEYMASVSVRNQFHKCFMDFDLCDDCMGDFKDFMVNTPLLREENK